MAKSMKNLVEVTRIRLDLAKNVFRFARRCAGRGHSQAQARGSCRFWPAPAVRRRWLT